MTGTMLAKTGQRRKVRRHLNPKIKQFFGDIGLILEYLILMIQFAFIAALFG